MIELFTKVIERQSQGHCKEYFLMITALTNLRATILAYIDMSRALFLCHVYDLINIETNVIPDIETNIPTKGYLNKK